MQEIPLLKALKLYNSQLNARDLLPLPVDTPYGNLSLTYLQIVARIEFLNKSITTIFNKFYKAQESVKLNNGWDESNEMLDHKFEIEEVIYWMRKTADDLIGILYIILQYKKSGNYPEQIYVSSIGSFLKLNDKSEYKLDNHNMILTILNEISNAYKHTLLNAQMHNHIGADEPVVFALSAFNKASDQPKYHSYTLRYVLKEYDFFLTNVKSILTLHYPSKWH